jgi:ribonuclease E
VAEHSFEDEHEPAELERAQAEDLQTSDLASPELVTAAATEPGPEPVSEAVAQPTPPAREIAQPEPPPRRGSTVREPAPGYFSSHADTTVPVERVEIDQPASTSPNEGEATEPEDSTRPRRSGWWSRRVLGKG